jgi:hypothetical protein
MNTNYAELCVMSMPAKEHPLQRKDGEVSGCNQYFTH